MICRCLYYNFCILLCVFHAYIFMFFVFYFSIVLTTFVVVNKRYTLYTLHLLMFSTYLKCRHLSASSFHDFDTISKTRYIDTVTHSTTISKCTIIQLFNLHHYVITQCKKMLSVERKTERHVNRDRKSQVLR